MAKQILGIVEGLKMIHYPDDVEQLVDPASRVEPSLLSHRSSDPKKYGRHGDLKPENILWFKTYHHDDQYQFMGLLKISDFGMTSFHESQTRSMVNPKLIGVSPTYRAPEYDIKKHISRSYDIWSLGCVLLELVTWYLLGWEGVDGFSKDRTEDDPNEIPQDVFFTLAQENAPNGHLRYLARYKMCVVKVSH
jgi:serine/threonine protein kinase